MRFKSFVSSVPWLLGATVWRLGDASVVVLFLVRGGSDCPGPRGEGGTKMICDRNS